MNYKKEFSKLLDKAENLENDKHLGICYLIDYDKLLRRFRRYKILVSGADVVLGAGAFWFPPGKWEPRVELLKDIIRIESSFRLRILFRFLVLSNKIKESLWSAIARKL